MTSSMSGLPSHGTTVTVRITRVNLNPNCVLIKFWGSFDQDRKLEYDLLKKEIQFPGELFHKAEGDPGDLCLVQVCDTWFRARIVSRNETKYSVFLIDEGRTVGATPSTLAWGRADFFGLPSEVEFCVLFNVLPLSSENRWSKMALEFLKTFSGRTVRATVQDILGPLRTFLLDIPCISTQMYQMGFAKEFGKEMFTNFVIKSLDCNGGLSEPWRSSMPTNNVAEHEMIKMNYLYPELQPKTVEMVIVTEVTSPLRIFCQLKVFSLELEKLTEQLTQYYDCRVGTNFARFQNLGAPCASKGTDGKWYRAILQQVTSSNMVEVLLVDYGCKQFVPKENVKPLPLEFFQMPVLTYICCLHGIPDGGVSWMPAQIDYLKSLLLKRHVLAKFEYRSPSEGVYYVTLYGDENTNINSIFALEGIGLMESYGDSTAHAVHEEISFFKTLNRNSTEVLKKSSLPVFSTEGLKPNTSYTAVVQHVDSPSKFWIQTQRYAAEFDQLMNNLEEVYQDLGSARGWITNPVSGLLCLVKSKDGVFYRAVVCDVLEAKVDVYYLDYGNREWVDCFSLRELPLRYQKLPALAVKCALYGIQPKRENWDEKATLFFSNVVLDKPLDVFVVAKSQDTHFVRVFNTISKGENDLAEMLCSADYAKLDTFQMDTDKPIVLSSFCTAFTSHSLSPTFREYTFPVGSSFDVTVSHIESPNDFWCQKTNSAVCLKELMEELQEFYKNSQFELPLETACVARHPENGYWYRVLVIQKHQTHATVLFIDYGETKLVSFRDLRHMDPAFLKLERQAFRCSLYRFQSTAHYALEWSPEDTVLFREFVDNAALANIVLKCTVYAVMYDSKKVVFNVVDLETPFQSICRHLIPSRLAGGVSSQKALPPLCLDTYFYSAHGIRAGSEEDVSITSVETVNRFFCQLERNSVMIHKLQEKINQLCKQLEKTNCSKTFGNTCFAKYRDGMWKRGLIRSIQPAIVVHFVDYGNTQEVARSDILPVPIEAGEIMAVPMQAVECKLSDMPQNVASEVNTWFKGCVTDRSLKALIVAKDPCGKFLVELYDGNTQLNMLMKAGFGVGARKNYSNEGPIKYQDQNGNVLENAVPCKLQRESQKGSVWTSENWRSPRSPNSTKCRNIQDSVKTKDSRVSLVRAKLLNEADLPVKMITPGLEAEVFISHYNSLSSFFVQFVEDEPLICSMVEKLNNDHTVHGPIFSSDLQQGHLVTAVFPEDNSWYRAAVRRAPAADLVDVEFIDFGNTAQVSVSKVCVLDRAFLSHRYSVKCSLKEMLSPEMASRFKKETEKNKIITFTFIQQSGDVWEVQRGQMFEPIISPAKPPVHQEMLYRMLKNPVLSVEQSFTGYASYINGPELFWCQNAESDKLQEISDTIQKAGLRNVAVNEEFLFLGSGCIVRFTDDQLWYRAKVTAKKTDALSVLFVDYGNESNVQMSDVKPLPLEVADVPGQAVACQLDLQEGSLDSNAADRFFELISDKLLHVTVLKLRESSYADVLHLVRVECDGVVINELMKDCGISSDALLDVTETQPGTNLPQEPFQTTSVPHTSTTSLSMEHVKDESVDPLLVPDYQAADVETLDAHEDEINNKDLAIENPQSSRLKQFNDDPEAAGPENSASVVAMYAIQSENVYSQRALHEIDILNETDHSEENLEEAPDQKSQDFSEASSKGPLDSAFSEDGLGHDVVTSENICSRSALRETDILNETDHSEEASDQERQEFSEAASARSSDSSLSEDGIGHDVVTSDFGGLRRAAEIWIGFECAVWSEAHTTWCRARTVKISRDYVTVLLLDHDSLMMVDQMNIFENVPMELLQNQSVVPDEPEAELLIDTVNSGTASEHENLDPHGFSSLTHLHLKVQDMPDEVISPNPKVNDTNP